MPLLRLLLTSLFVSLLPMHGLWAQLTPSASQNYIIEQTPRTPQTTVGLSSSYLDVAATIAYTDGLGRPLQTVQLRGAGDASADLVTNAITYDAYGRPQTTTLPVPGGQNGSLLTSPIAAGQSFYGDQNPYAETTYEASPLNRPTRQFGAGAAWRTANRAQSVRYGTAAGVLRFKVSLAAVFANVEGQPNYEYFGGHDIATRITTDEQNHQTIDYTDLQGRTLRRDVVLTAGDTLTTAYAYDNFERLAAVIPPKLYNWFKAGNTALLFRTGDPFSGPDNPVFKENCFVYLYDVRSRLASRHVPNAGWTQMVYDRLDRLVMSQDQQDAADGKWRLTRYDGLNRVIYSGRMTLNRSVDDLRTDFSGTFPLTVSDERDNNGLVGYTNQSFPSTVPTAEADLLTVNYYDTPPASSTLTYQGSIAPWPNNTGLMTGGRVRNLETQAWYESAMWYDDKARVLEQLSQNHLAGVDKTDMTYQFNGELLKKTVNEEGVLNNSSVGTYSGTFYAYDHISRPISMSYDVADEPFEMARYSYDAVGRLAQKRLMPTGGGGSTGQPVIMRTTTPTIPTTDLASQYIEITPGTFDVNLKNGSGLYEARTTTGGSGNTGGPALQTLDYRYHIRGWLRGVNVDASGQPALNTSRGDVFGFGLDYETAGYYDGNIGRQRWVGSRQPGQTRSYQYSYDAVSRLLGASYGGAAGEDYSLSGMGYDPNGNIQSLNRAGLDQLTYRYGEGNKLLAVSDAISGTAGFADTNPTGDDYDYYPDGSLKKDLNRGISQIDYNLLKLPRQVSFTNGKVVAYQYDASGRKLRMSSPGLVRHYTTQAEYVNGAFSELHTPEGRLTNDVPGELRVEYFVRDHLGNIRAVLNDSAGVAVLTQHTDYDPWGLELTGLSGGRTTNANRLKFNGKETLGELGAGLLDFGARGYDATIGRWGVADPLAEAFESVSPFSFGLNNPVVNVDPGGDSTVRYDDLDMHTFDTRKDDVQMQTVVVKTQRSEENKAYIGAFAQSLDWQQMPSGRGQGTPGVGSTPYTTPPASGRAEGDYTFESYFVGGKLLKPLVGGIGAIVGRLTKHGELTNGVYTISQEAMKKHVFGGVQGKSIFYPTLDANAAVLKAAQYADEAGLWIGNKAKVPVLNTNIGTLGNGQPTNIINVYRNSNGFIHGSPGSIR